MARREIGIRHNKPLVTVKKTEKQVNAVVNYGGLCVEHLCQRTMLPDVTTTLNARHTGILILSHLFFFVFFFGGGEFLIVLETLMSKYYLSTGMYTYSDRSREKAWINDPGPMYYSLMITIIQNIPNCDFNERMTYHILH